MGTYILDKEKAIAFALNPSEYNVMIRVTDPKASFSPLKNDQIYTDVLTLKFYDLEDDNTGLFIFNETHLDNLLDFFNKHKNCQNMVIHCDKGKSRSAALAVGWFLFNDAKSNIYKLYHDKIHFPNRRIVEYFYKYFKADIRHIDKWENEWYYSNS
jgi:predicted protein tyrosine phosphatase